MSYTGIVTHTRLAHPLRCSISSAKKTFYKNSGVYFVRK